VSLIARIAVIVALTPLVACGPIEINANQIRTIDDVPHLGPGERQIDLVDVGHGLAILVRSQGAVLLYDGGTSEPDELGDDRFGDSRLLAWLFATVGPSGDADCTPSGDDWEPIDRRALTLDLLVLSHPHEDHGLLLDEVVACYDVAEAWLPGSVNEAPFYGELTGALAAAEVPWRAPRELDGLDADLHGSLEAGHAAALGTGIDVTVLSAPAEARPDDLNDSSLVLRVDLGDFSLLLTGDAGSGSNEDPDQPVAGIERALIDDFGDALDVDVLQVGHHGSRSGSRAAFLDAVSPDWALISAGPAWQSLPQPDVVEALLEHVPDERLLRTDASDGDWRTGDDCPERIGRDDCALPGGLDSWILEVGR
jgi:competence protein ComEC